MIDSSNSIFSLISNVLVVHTLCTVIIPSLLHTFFYTILQIQTLLKRFEPYLSYPHNYVEDLSLLPQPEVITASRQCSNNTHHTVSSSGTVACIYHQSNPIYTATLDTIPHESDNDSVGSSPGLLLNLASSSTSSDKPYTAAAFVKPLNLFPPATIDTPVGDVHARGDSPEGKK